MVLSEVKRKQLNKNLPTGLFIDSDCKLRLKKSLDGKLWEKQFGTYEPGLVAAAEEFLFELKKKARLGQLGLQLDPETLTLREAVAIFDKNHISKKPTNKARVQYRLAMDRIITFFGADRAVDTITPQDVIEFREWCAKRMTHFGRPITPITVNHDHTALIALFNALDRYQVEGTIPDQIRLPKRNPAHYVPKAGKGETKIHPPTFEQFQSLMINADNGLRRIILGASVMMRRKQELMEMRISNVDECRGVIMGQVSKRKRQDQDRLYTVVVTPTVRMLIDSRPAMIGDYLFNFANFRNRWERTLRRAGLRVKGEIIMRKGKPFQTWINKVQFRALRKIGGTFLNLEKIDPRTIQEMYRHSSLEMTQIYVGAVPEAMREAAARLDAKLAWHEKVDDSVDYSRRYENPKYLKST